MVFAWLELPWICSRTVAPSAARWLPGLVTVTWSVADVARAQSLAALLHSGCIANVPDDSVTVPRSRHAHLSPTSPPEESLGSHQPRSTSGSVTVSAYSWPPTIEKPSY